MNNTNMFSQKIRIGLRKKEHDITKVNLDVDVVENIFGDFIKIRNIHNDFYSVIIKNDWNNWVLEFNSHYFAGKKYDNLLMKTYVVKSEEQKNQSTEEDFNMKDFKIVLELVSNFFTELVPTLH